ncbi:hypothetical protein ARAM_003381 [Aspergillus rambellii]|uniref:Uncharacterized protein n=1 Tax=Aspergillus rambellii TaxID=308745 RepID=A0A0F8UJQ8_9EURO|nr:hypothetical protein ARAM_003381 [Aspergillus rambellii]
MSAPITQSLSSLGSSMGAYSRQQLATLRNRFLTTGQDPLLVHVSIAHGLMFTIEKRRRRAQIVQTSFAVHRPVWVTAGGAGYTTMVAVYLTMRYMRRLPH